MTDQQPRRTELLGGAGSHELASVTVTEHGASLVLAIGGEVDISNINSIAEVIYALPNTEDGLLIDLTDVSYLDSSAVSLLHDLAMRLRNRAQQLIVVSPPATPPRRILDLTALYVNAPVADELDGGLRLLGSSEPP
ncbi:MAG TPA: STAS domain-containing protein [Solirubrobacteraceae bacterium]|jgi:anti-anti-sigma factor|nr:STAS domain-containing protein [Solirubrobacteraceae bacterium]